MDRERMEVLRSFRDNHGELQRGDLPPLERTAEYPETNYRSLQKAKFMTPYAGDTPADSMPGQEPKETLAPPPAGPAKKKSTKKTTRKVGKKTGKRTKRGR